MQATGENAENAEIEDAEIAEKKSPFRDFRVFNFCAFRVLSSYSEAVAGSSLRVRSAIQAPISQTPHSATIASEIHLP